MSGDPKRTRRWIVWTALGVVLAIVAGLGALRMNASRLEAEVQEAAARSAARPARSEPAGRPQTSRPYVRAGASAPVVSRAARHVAMDAPSPLASRSLPNRAALPAPPDLDTAIDHLMDEGAPGFMCMVTPRLGLAMRDGDYLLPGAVRSWLDDHAVEIDVVAAGLASDDGDSAARQILNPGLLICVLTADAVRWTEDGEKTTADESMDALLRLTIAAGDEDHGYWIADPGLLRRVRPSNALGWIARIDAASPREDCLGFIRNRALLPRPSGPVRLQDPTLDVLHDDLPGSIRGALDAALFTPLEDARWARRSMAMLELHDELAGSVGCLRDPVRDGLLPYIVGERDWQDVWESAVVQEADLLVAREVLRLAHPEAGIAPRASPCPDWSIDVEALPDGTRRVKVFRSNREVGMPMRNQTPLEYELPP